MVWQVVVLDAFPSHLHVPPEQAVPSIEAGPQLPLHGINVAVVGVGVGPHPAISAPPQVLPSVLQVLGEPAQQAPQLPH